MGYYFRLILLVCALGLTAIPLAAQDANRDEAPDVVSDAGAASAEVENAETPESEEVIEPSPETEVVQQQCVPDCHVGFVCNQGICVSACNPPCSAGFECTAEATCVAEKTPGPPVPPPVSRDLYAERLARREQIRQERLELRMKYRQSPRFMLAVVLGIGGLSDEMEMMAYFTPTVGFKMNVVEMFGFQARVGGMLGLIDLGITSTDFNGDTHQSDPVGFGGFYSEAGVFVGPFGRFYIGPYGWLSITKSFEDEVIVGDYSWDIPKEADGLMGGGGIDMGIRVGKREHIDIHWRVRSTFNDTMPFALEGGVAFHFMAD